MAKVPSSIGSWVSQPKPKPKVAVRAPVAKRPAAAAPFRGTVPGSIGSWVQQKPKKPIKRQQPVKKKPKPKPPPVLSGETDQGQGGQDQSGQTDQGGGGPYDQGWVGYGDQSYDYSSMFGAGAEAAGGQKPAKVPKPKPWNPETDPIVAAARGQSNQMIESGKAALLAQQKQELIGFGSQSLAKSILGETDPLISTITENPQTGFSYLANLKRKYGTVLGQPESWTGSTRYGLIPTMEESLGGDNLWFSSYHADQLRNLEQQRLGEQSVEQQRIQNLLSGYQTSYTDIVQQAKDRLQQTILQRQAMMGAL